MIDYWGGSLDFGTAVRTGALDVQGPRRLVNRLPTWFLRSPFAKVPLPRATEGSLSR